MSSVGLARASRAHPGFVAALVHRLSGLALAVFLPLHFLALGLAFEAERFAEGTRGELTLVVAGRPDTPEAVDPEALDAEIRERLAAGEGAKQIAAALARPGLPRRELYARVVALQKSGDD